MCVPYGYQATDRQTSSHDNEYTRSNKIDVGHSFYAVRVIAKEIDDWFFPELV
jgi:hypothetical protein